jgi:hypothetical protein
MCSGMLQSTIARLQASWRRPNTASPPGSEVGHVGHPELVGTRRAELTLDQVVGAADAGHADVVRPRLRRTTPLIPASRIKRSTRLRPTRMPCASRRSAWILGDP